MTDGFNYTKSVKDIEMEIDQSVQDYCLRFSESSMTRTTYSTNGGYYKDWYIDVGGSIAWLSVMWDGKQHVCSFKNSLEILNGK